jgi:NAD(P)-dependent dehydrogenase (short-subunit alcohol dehydrogenase family)
MSRMRAVVTGASRGIGAELVRALLARGDRVVAGMRAPGPSEHERLTTLVCDVRDGASVRAFAEAASEGPVDLVINNAGVGGISPTIEKLDVAQVAAAVDVNTLGALRVTQALLPALERGRGKKVVNITSILGSIAEHTGSTGVGGYPYRVSKAALNMATRCLANDLQDRGIVVVALHPGWVRTAMGGPSAPLTVEESVASMLRVIDALDLDQTGRFLDHRGGELPW